MNIVKNNAGFTLFEILLVLFFTVGLTALGLVGLGRLQTMFRLRSIKDEITARMQYGRSLAIANKNSSIYSIMLSGQIFTLRRDGGEIDRVSIPSQISISPASFSMSYTPISGTIPSCSPCSFLLTEGQLIENITISSNGIIN